MIRFLGIDIGLGTYKPSVQDIERIARFFGVPIAAFFPDLQPSVKVQALLSATGDLEDEDLDEVTRYAQYRKARKELKRPDKIK